MGSETKKHHLKRCPYCGFGSEDESLSVVTVSSGMFAVACTVCQQHGPECTTEEGAVSAFNIRKRVGTKRWMDS